VSVRAQQLLNEPLPEGSSAILWEIVEHDPGAVRAAILRAFIAGGGSPTRASAELGVSRRTLERWVDRMRLRAMIIERWPR